jgi:pimeloyl-ACP methyl ester carboxylesterase
VAATVVLVHGAWHGAWCFERVVPGLEELGVGTVALDLPGHGRNPAPLGDLHSKARFVEEEIERVGAPVVLLGHSFGGMVVTEAGAHPNVRHLVYLCAFMPEEGESLADLVESVEDPGLKAPMHTMPGERDGEVLFNPEFGRELFYGDASDRDVERALARLEPEPGIAFAQPPDRIAWRDRPSTYVVCTDDQAILRPLQMQMARHATETVEWPTSHSPFLSRPELVVELLAELAGRY